MSEQSARGGLLTMLLAAAFVVALDQATKSAARQFLTEGVSVNLIGSVVRLTLVRNMGLAFGIELGKSAVPLLAVLAAMILTGIMLRRRRLQPANQLPPFTILLIGIGAGAAIGNLIDRGVFGAVTDFIELPYWPVFNVADIGLTVVAIALLWRVLWGRGQPPSAASSVKPS